ncbi:MAG: hypothetical protein EOM91_18010 [Sphingobacteriia bacterium]|nr:hypothetical protein [Sphingobacteriia bacterium]NCC38802.1 hypothetical protein [Gammaproteobacteria bacterium]
MIEPRHSEPARARIATEGFTPDLQSKIAVLLGATKGDNAAYHSWVQSMARWNVMQQYAFTQYSREIDAISELIRVTRWSSNPAILIRGHQIVAPLTLGWSRILMVPLGSPLNPEVAYRGLALGHAQWARMRLTPVIPECIDLLDPFVVALRRVEQEGARMLQTQMRLLKTIDSGLTMAEREACLMLYQDIVGGVFSDFLDWLAAP